MTNNLYFYNNNWELFKKTGKFYFFNIVTTKLLEPNIKTKQEENALVFLLKIAAKPQTKKQLISKIHKKFPKLNLNWIGMSFDNLTKRGIVKLFLPIPKEFKGKYSLGLERQLESLNEIFPDLSEFQAQKKLKNAKITIIGLGIVGQSVLIPLIASGINNFVCIDFDTVEERNIGRQILFRKGDQGRLKTEVIKNFIEENYPQAKIKTLNKLLDNVDDIKKAITTSSIVIQCCDYPRFLIHRLINTACLDLKIPTLVLGSYRVGPFCIPYKTACYGCLETLLRKNLFIYDDVADRIQSQGTRRFPQLIITSFLTATLGAKEVITYLLGLPTQTLNACLHFDLKTLAITREPIPRQRKCYACSLDATRQ